jgi:hypothetical protein
VTNLFAWRATDPKELLSSMKSVGPENDFFIKEAATKSTRVLAAWGCNGDMIARADHVLAFLKSFNIAVDVLDVTKAGQPKHPLYLNGNLKPRPYYV